MAAKVKLAYINEPDVAAYLDTLSNFSAWVRAQARAEMAGSIDPALARMVERLLETKLAGRVGAVDQFVESREVPAGLEGFW